ncbi:unnamed protein product, partial [Thlaspi arvense]
TAFRRIIRNKSTEQFSGLPYICALLTCLLCAWYGIHTFNSAGAVCQLTYITLFIVYTERAQKLRMFGLLVAVFGLFAIIIVGSLQITKFPTRHIFVEIISGASLVSMSASPLFIISLVIQTRSVEFMPLYLSLSIFSVNKVFFLYGILRSDPFIYICMKSVERRLVDEAVETG